MTRYALYDEDGSPLADRCPECDDAFLAEHGDRRHCGKCGYAEVD